MIQNLSYSIGNVKVAPGLILAPMSGVTCRPFRRLIKELNPDCVGLTVTEFISVEALTRNVKRSIDMMHRHESESPFCIQIFGFDIERMALAAQIAESAGADIVDINCGCPAPKVVRKGGGCELMRQPEHLGKILNKVRSSIKVPLTLKMRSGWDSNVINAIEIAKVAESEGVNALAVHGRTRTQMYRGESDWSIIAKVVEAVKIPVLGSGDVVDYQSAKVRLEQSNVAGLMIGRGALNSPFVFAEVCGKIDPNWRQDESKILATLKRYIELLREDMPEKLISGRVKQLSSGLCKGLRWRKALLTTQTNEQLEALLDDPEYYMQKQAGSSNLSNSNQQAIIDNEQQYIFD